MPLARNIGLCREHEGIYILKSSIEYSEYGMYDWKMHLIGYILIYIGEGGMYAWESPIHGVPSQLKVH